MNLKIIKIRHWQWTDVAEFQVGTTYVISLHTVSYNLGPRLTLSVGIRHTHLHSSYNLMNINEQNR